MSRKFLLTALSITIVFQCLVLSVEYINTVYPLWMGREVKLRTVPVDPRSMFRGNYARLNYEISNIPVKDINKLITPRHGEIIYVKLRAGKDSLYAYDGVSLDKPDNDVHIRGRIQSFRGVRNEGNYQIKYGIEAYFAPKAKALKLEKELRSSGLAIVMVANNGKAALKEILSE